jgi:hypothetical protein
MGIKNPCYKYGKFWAIYRLGNVKNCDNPDFVVITIFCFCTAFEMEKLLSMKKRGWYSNDSETLWVWVNRFCHFVPLGTGLAENPYHV